MEYKCRTMQVIDWENCDPNTKPYRAVYKTVDVVVAEKMEVIGGGEFGKTIYRVQCQVCKKIDNVPMNNGTTQFIFCCCNPIVYITHQ